MAEDVVAHIGVKRRSGRYPWGSGGANRTALEKLIGKGFTEKEMAKALGISTTELRNQKAIVKAEIKEAQRLNVIRQKERGMSIAAISREFKIPASSVTELLKPAAALKYKIIHTTANILRKIIGEKRFVDVGEGSEVYMGVPRPKLDNAITLLTNEGYKVYNLKQEQLGSPGRQTNIKILGAKDSTFKELLDSRADIAIPGAYSKDNGESFIIPPPPKNISSSKVLVKYKEDGGAEKDGLIEIRAGVPEYTLNGKSYAQVRIGVDDSHYMKGMAVLRDDLPKGTDFVYYTSKSKPSDGNKLSALKEQKTDDDGSYVASVFGAVVKPNEFVGPDGKTQFGPVNIVGEYTPSEQGAWTSWRKSLASQVLSKQSPRLAEEQLKIVYENQKAELDEIKSLTNPVVRNHLLLAFADKADTASVQLQAAALPRQSTNVLLPDPDLKPNEIYAPNYKNGENVAVIRYPHGGVFEIASLKVNNKTSEYRNIIGTDVEDAVAVHPKTAQKLSGADFDGDFVLVIPNRDKKIRISPSLEGLKNFDSKSYAIPDDLLYDKKTNPKGIKPINDTQKQRLMGDVSNLITDMTIMGADQSEIARAVRHSMVVIDAEKHKLNVKQSEIDNGIKSLKETYQGGRNRGAATLISKSKSELRIPQIREHYDIDPDTGEKVFTFTNATYINKKTGNETLKTTKTSKGAVDVTPTAARTKRDAHDLSSGTVIESVYADHANRMHDLGNKARLETLKPDTHEYSRSARLAYADEVESLNAKHSRAVKSRPMQRKAQLLGGEIYRQKVDGTPNMSNREKMKWKGRSLRLAQKRLDAAKPTIDITPREWEAIEMGAISKTRLKSILRNADMDVVRQYATPRALKGGLSTGKKTRALNLLKNGYTNAEVAQALGVPVNQIATMEKD